MGGAPKCVLMLMADDADMSFECEIRISDLVEECNCDRKTMERYLATLEAKGYITKMRVGNQWQYTRYRLNISYEDAGGGFRPTPKEVSALQLTFEELVHERARLGLDQPHPGAEAHEPPGALSQNAPSTPGALSQNAPSTPGALSQNAPSTPGAQNAPSPREHCRTIHPGSTAQNAPSTPGALSQNAPSTPGALSQNAPSTPGALSQNAPSTPGALSQNAPSTPGALSQNAPSTPGALSQNAPSTPGALSQNAPSTPGALSQNAPSTPGGALSQNAPSTPGALSQNAPSTPGALSQNAPSTPLINNNINNKNNYLIKGQDRASNQTTLPAGLEQIATLPGYRPRDGDLEFIDRVVLRCREENVEVTEVVAVAVRYLEASGRVPEAGHPLRFLSKTVDVQIDQVKRGQGRRAPRESERSGRLYTAEMYPQEDNGGYRTGDHEEDSD